jgi:hypothetical protein
MVLMLFPCETGTFNHADIAWWTLRGAKVDSLLLILRCLDSFWLTRLVDQSTSRTPWLIDRGGIMGLTAPDRPVAVLTHADLERRRTEEALNPHLP